MDIANIRSKSSKELRVILTNLRKEFVNSVFQRKLGQCRDISHFRSIRKSIARVLTILSKRKIEEKDA